MRCAVKHMPHTCALVQSQGRHLTAVAYRTPAAAPLLPGIQPCAPGRTPPAIIFNGMSCNSPGRVASRPLPATRRQ